MIEPGWAITMMMWPIPKAPPRSPPDLRLLPSGFLKSTEIKVKQAEVFTFPSGETVDSELSLHVALFPFRFSDQILNERVIINCNLTLPMEHPETNGNFIFVCKAFFKPSKLSTSLEKIEGPNTALEASCKILIETTSEHFFAVLVQRPRSQTTFKFSVDFEFRGTLGDGTPTNLIQEPVMVSASVDEVYRDGSTPFSWALTHNWEDDLKLLLEQWKVLKNFKDSHGLSGLSWAARIGHEAAFTQILEHAKENVDNEDNSGRTPLSWAAGEGHMNIVYLLLRVDEKTDPRHPDQKGRTPLSWAAEGNHVKIVELILRQT